MTPNIDENGVPWCIEKCKEHDGKRCELLGHRPDSICEPYVIKLVEKIKFLEGKILPTFRRINNHHMDLVAEYVSKFAELKWKEKNENY